MLCTSRKLTTQYYKYWQTIPLQSSDIHERHWDKDRSKFVAFLGLGDTSMGLSGMVRSVGGEPNDAMKVALQKKKWYGANGFLANFYQHTGATVCMGSTGFHWKVHPSRLKRIITFSSLCLTWLQNEIPPQKIKSPKRLLLIKSNTSNRSQLEFQLCFKISAILLGPSFPYFPSSHLKNKSNLAATSELVVRTAPMQLSETGAFRSAITAYVFFL